MCSLKPFPPWAFNIDDKFEKELPGKEETEKINNTRLEALLKKLELGKELGLDEINFIMLASNPGHVRIF